MRIYHKTDTQIANLRELAKTHYVSRYYLATIYGMLGEKDKAFAELEKSFAERDCYLGRMSVDPFMDRLRNGLRFKNRTQRMHLP